MDPVVASDLAEKEGEAAARPRPHRHAAGRDAARARRRPMRALVIAPQPFFSPRGTPFSVYHRTRVIAEQGIDVDFLTYGEGQDVEIPRVRIIRIPRFAFLGNVKVGPSKLKLFLDLFLLLWTIGLLIRRRYDFVHAHEEAVFFCLFLKPLFPFSLVYDMHSSLPEQLINFKFTRSKFLLGLFRRLEEASLRNSDAVITICPDLAEYAQSLGIWVWDRLHRWFEKGHVKYYRTEELIALLRDGGFERVEVTTLSPSYAETRKLARKAAVFSATVPR